jgi:Flp pilus assembly protein TadD
MPSQLSLFERMTFRGMLLAPMMLVVLLAGCESKSPTEEAKKMEKPQTGAAMEQAATEPKEMKVEEEMKMEAPAEMKPAPLTAPVSSAGQKANAEGVTHAQQGHWDVAESHFRKALEADPKLAEAHYNLGLALDKLDRHDEAKAAFEKALELAPNNSMITESPVLKKHMST